MTLWMRWLAAAALLLAGAVTGLATVAVHELGWGLPLALAATALTVVALPGGWWSRLAFVVGWDGMVGWLTLPRPEGDYVLSQDVQGYVVLGVALLLLVVAIGTLPQPRRREPDRAGVGGGVSGDLGDRPDPAPPPARRGRGC